MAATPTSCNSLRGTGRRSRYWSIRRIVKNRVKEAELVVRCDVNQPIGQDRPHLGVQLRLAIQTCAELLLCEQLAQQKIVYRLFMPKYILCVSLGRF